MKQYNFNIKINSNESIDTVLGEILSWLHDMQDNQLTINNFVMNYWIDKK